ncbi:MAG TPA: aspartate carbamoyltransferase [Candidatus Limnocylindrales bacterium]|nr:aspartate carbamoyltransferase [Candidatus Limnocylindrales bacterium]
MNDLLTVAPTRSRVPLRHLVDAASLDRPLVEAILNTAGVMASLSPLDGAAPLRGRILACLFFEPSTRTRLSFEAAMLRLGGQVIGAQDALASSSAAKGESLEDTIRVVSSYADAIVLRHPERGAAARATRASAVPILNGGDGAGEHPTQALLDLYTMQAELGRIGGLHVGLSGDLKHSRTTRSLALLLALFPDVRLTLISPPSLRMEPEVIETLRVRGVEVGETGDLHGAAATLDVLYQTRLQRERFDGAADVMDVPIVDRRVLSRLPDHAIVMHPLPRVNEIDEAVDADPRAAYFRQARNGLYVRMAVLEWLLGARP